MSSDRSRTTRVVSASRFLTVIVLSSGLSGLAVLPATASTARPVKTILIKTGTVSGLGTFVVTAQGYTLYHNTQDTSTTSACTR